MSGLVDIAGGAGMGALQGGPVGAAIGGGMPLLELLLGLDGGGAPPPPGLPGGGAGAVDMNPTQTQVSPGAKSAHGRTLADFDNQVTVNAEMPQVESLPLPMDQPQTLEGMGGAGALAAPLIDDAGLAPSGGEAPPIPPPEGGGGLGSAFGEMDPLQLAMMGLTLGSGLFGGPQTPPPRPPGLPGSSFSPMRPMR